MFSVSPLEFDHWMWCIFFGVSTLLWHQLMMFIPDTIFQKLKFWKMRSKVKVDNIKSDYYANGVGIDSNTSVGDMDKMAQSKLLWVRGIARIHNQLDVVSVFRTKLEENAKSKSLNGSHISLKELR